MKQSIAYIIVLGLFLIGISFAGAEENKPYTGSKQFEQIKKLKGTWRGPSSMSENGEPVTVTYEVSSAGSSVVETLFVGQPYEMTSVYHDIDGKLGMTHYCSLRNQPSLSLREAKDNELDFIYTSGTNLDPKKDKHIHALNLKFLNENKMVQTWVGFENGKQSHANVLTLSRVK